MTRTISKFIFVVNHLKPLSKEGQLT
uniref:Uncharacterized protein n=1 Tax=Rhizophora mucronata TaxID=61149 RepID=A0A2P2QDG2_RHIMU